MTNDAGPADTENRQVRALRIVPCSISAARRFVGEHHRHNLPPQGGLFAAAYGAITRAAKALGYRRAITYTLQSEPGTSLRAAGWTHDADLEPSKSWSRPSRPRIQQDLFGEDRRPTEGKRRWTKQLAA